VRHATHVRKRSEFEHIQRSGSRVNTERFVLILCAQSEPSAATRLGITASRRIGGAVVRNRAKRLVRAAFRATAELFPAGLDLVVVVRKPLGELKLAAVVDEWRGAANTIRRRARDLLARDPGGAKASP
jgi:ribonuclease P protein component